MAAAGESQEKVAIRNVDPEVWRKVKAAAVEMGMPLGQLVTSIFREWLERRAKQD